MKPRVVIVSPALADANNGNWRTADRWQHMLSGKFHAIVQAQWPGQAPDCDALIALHARRSFPSIAAFRAAAPQRPLVVVLTGTDAYRDLPDDPDARQALKLADALVVLQEGALDRLPAAARRKTYVIHQSCRTLTPAKRPARLLKCVVVGHLREEKSPQTIFDAVAQLAPGAPVRIDHVGAPLDAGLAAQARALAGRAPRYRYLGALPHAQARQAIRRAHLLIHPSQVEGGANAIAEAVTAGTAVLASKISGNVGMLGAGYPGYFEWNDARALARMLERFAADHSLLAPLDRAIRARAGLFDPQTERNALHRLLSSLLEPKAVIQSGLGRARPRATPARTRNP
ncbi:MAG: TIGR04348 family glycosyltransferase [Betaproteobacteria bacterium]|nr:TIGR04348 family glycosyltransferase [Betaproteobacteria bacterium]